MESSTDHQSIRCELFVDEEREHAGVLLIDRSEGDKALETRYWLRSGGEINWQQEGTWQMQVSLGPEYMSSNHMTARKRPGAQRANEIDNFVPIPLMVVYAAVPAHMRHDVLRLTREHLDLLRANLGKWNEWTQSSYEKMMAAEDHQAERFGLANGVRNAKRVLDEIEQLEHDLALIEWVNRGRGYEYWSRTQDW